MKLKFSAVLPWLLIVIVVVGFGAYIVSRPAPVKIFQTVTSLQTAATLQKVDFMIDFVPAGIYTPLYVGVDKGYFAKYGLQVNLIHQPQGSAGDIRAVAAGRVDLGMGDVGTFLVLRAQENLTNLRAIAPYFAKTPQAIIFLEGKDRPTIKTPKDLEGKTVGTFVGNGENYMFPVFCKANNVDYSKVKIVNSNVATLASGLLGGKFDAVLLFNRAVADLKPEASKEGLNVGSFNFADYGLDVYADMIYAKTDLINNEPGMVKKFLQGFEEALQFSVAHPNEAVSSTLKFNPQLDPNVTRGEWDIAAQSMGGKAILNAKDPLTNGWIDHAKMQTTITTVSAAYSVRAPDPSVVYTNQFVKAP